MTPEVTVAVVGVGTFLLSSVEGTMLAVRLREIAREHNADEQTLALTFETSLAAGADTIVVEAVPLFRDALALVVGDTAATATAGLRELQRALVG